MVTTIAIIAGVLVALCAFAATKPDPFRIERATSIKAPPEKIFALISDFRSWDSWSPWEKMDPGMTRTHSGAANGKGAVYEWEGNKKVGKGRMEITDAAPPSKLTIKLDFLEPFAAHDIAEFTLEAEGDSIRLTWAMHGPSPYFAKLMSIFSSMDRMVGKDFAIGLANLKTVAES